jgi:hypothetical protein
MKKLQFKSGVLLLLLALMSTGHAQDKRYIPVFCNQGHSLQDAIDRATEGALIDVFGTCNESVVIQTDGLRIFGDHATLNPPAGSTAILVKFADNVSIHNFEIIGGAIGIQILQGSSTRVINNTIRESTDVGLQIANGSYGEIGFNLFHSTSGNFTQIQVLGSSSAELDDNIITASSGGAIDAAWASSVTVRFNNISGTASGLRVGQNAHMFLGSSNIVNTISCGFSGSLRVDAVQTITGGAGAVTLDPGCDLDNLSGSPFPP